MADPELLAELEAAPDAPPPRGPSALSEVTAAPDEPTAGESLATGLR